jgi:hypothetical protein
VMDLKARQPAQLAELLKTWNAKPERLYEAPPSLVLAVIGQGRLVGHVSPEEESTLIARLLTHWALKTTLDTASYCVHHRNSQTQISQAV